MSKMNHKDKMSKIIHIDKIIKKSNFIKMRINKLYLKK